MRAFRTPVRGHAYAACSGHVGPPAPGEPAQLVREPANPADPHAVAVWIGDERQRWRIGYLDRGVAARLAPRMDRGQRLAAVIDGWLAEPEGRWHRPVLVVQPEEDDEDPATALTPSPLAARPPGVLRRRIR